jgi:hypothetical protein
VPFTFFAHQAPVLPLVERNPGRWDGVALVAGSMAPDLAYVTNGWGYGPWGIALWFDGHRLANLPTVTIGGALLAVLVRKIVLVVFPLAVPDGGVLHLADYRNIARRTPKWWVTLGSALVGALTHIVLDDFTHPDGAVVQAVGLLRTNLFTIGGHTVRIYSLLQTVGSVVLGVIALWSLMRIGRARLFARPSDVSGRRPSLGRRQLWIFWSIIAVGVVGGLAYAHSRAGRQRVGATTFNSTTSTLFIAGCWVMFVALVVACVVLRPAAKRADEQSVG